MMILPAFILSSIIFAFFLTGKPFITCDTKNFHSGNASFWSKKILECAYIAKNWNDVKGYIKQIVSGNDYLYYKRKEVAIALSNENAAASLPLYVVEPVVVS